MCTLSLHTDWYRISVINLKLCRLVILERRSGRQQVEEHFQQVHILPCHIGDLEDWTHSARQKHTFFNLNIPFQTAVLSRYACVCVCRCVHCQHCNGNPHLSELKFDAVTMTSSLFWTSTGIFLHPGDFSSLCRSFRVSEIQ